MIIGYWALGIGEPVRWAGNARLVLLRRSKLRVASLTGEATGVIGHWGASAVVRQSGFLPRGDAKGDSAALASHRASGGFPHEELPKGFPDLRRLASLVIISIRHAPCVSLLITNNAKSA
ncbi:hypothetical protein [uncultured Nostoc sp.]|uniref:hypothetical protein n=1 Tax=uncultured Nostoc sp. TaxID=340711 RepID=UPI0035CC1CD2